MSWRVAHAAKLPAHWLTHGHIAQRYRRRAIAIRDHRSGGTRADSNPLLVGVGFAGVVERGRPVFKIAVLVEDAGKKQNWAMRAGGNPLAVAGEGVVSQ